MLGPRGSIYTSRKNKFYGSHYMTILADIVDAMIMIGGDDYENQIWLQWQQGV